MLYKHKRKPKGAIKNGQSRDTGNIWYTRHRTKNTTQKIGKWAHFLLFLECITSWLHFHDIFFNHHSSKISAWEFLPVYFKRTVTTEIYNLKIILMFVIREIESPSTTSELRYFSTLNSWMFKYMISKLSLKFEWRNIVISW